MTSSNTERAPARLRAGAHPLRAVLFDVDGTLVDSIPFLVDCFRETSASVLDRQIDDDFVRPLVGMPLGEMFRRVRPDLDDVGVDACVNAYRAVYLPACAARSPLFADAERVIRSLRDAGVALGIVSGKHLVGIRRILEPTGILEHFDAVVGSDHPGSGKPSPDHALAAAEQLGVAPRETLVVGDSLLDIDMGRAAGMWTAGVATGTYVSDELATRAHIVTSNLADLLDALVLEQT